MSDFSYIITMSRRIYKDGLYHVQVKEIDLYNLADWEQDDGWETVYTSNDIKDADEHMYN